MLVFCIVLLSVLIIEAGLILAGDGVLGFMYELTIVTVQRMSQSFRTVQMANNATEAFLVLSDAEVTDFNWLGHKLYQQLAFLPDQANLIYAADPLGNLNGLGREPGLDVPFNWQLVNASTSLNIRYAAVSPSCAMLDLSCTLGELETIPVLFNSSTRPWFIAAVEAGEATWSSLYLYTSVTPPRPVGITAAKPLYQTNSSDLRAVLAVVRKRRKLCFPTTEAGDSVVGEDDTTGYLLTFCDKDKDLTLTDIRDFLIRLAMVTLDSFKPFIYIVNEQGSLVAASSTSVVLQKTEEQGCDDNCTDVNVCCLLPAVDAVDEIISSTARTILGSTGNWSTLSLDYQTFSYFDYAIGVQGYEFMDDRPWFVVVVVDITVFVERVKGIFTIIIPILASTLLVISSLASYFITRSLIRPLKMASKQILAVAKLDMSDSAALPAGLRVSEVEEMTEALTSMKSSLKSFAKYVPQSVVQLLMQQRREAILGLDETFITIFFSDVTDFATISETLVPEDLVEVLSEYLETVSQIILESNGVVDKYIGDICMAFWNAPLPVLNHQAIACDAALKAQLRLQYLAKGDNVNLTSRLQGLNKTYGTNILITRAIEEVVRGRYLIRPLDRVAVKGKSKAVEVFELVDFKVTASEADRRRVRLFTDAYELYLSRQFSSALVAFTSYLAFAPNDRAAIRHREASRMYMETPPLAEWDGVLRMTEK